jgi:peroxiredoxin
MNNSSHKAKLRTVFLYFSQVFVITAICIAGYSQSKTIPVFEFSKLNGTGKFTDRNIPSGKKSLFIFFDVTCPHCQTALETFNKNVEQLKNVSVYLVTLDVQDRAINFLSKVAKDLYQRKNVTILFDQHNQFISRFEPVQYPSMLLYSVNKKLELYSHEPQDVSKFLLLTKN